MGKRIIQQARGHGSLSYRVKRSSYSIKPGYPQNLNGKFRIIKIVNSGGHTAPLVKLKSLNENLIFFNISARGLYEGQEIEINGSREGDISRIGDLKNGTLIFNIENRLKDGGKFVRSGGNSATILNKLGNKVVVLLPSKQEKIFDENCRATIGVIAGHGRIEKPFLKAGKRYYLMKTKSKLWPRTSAVKMNAIDHPFGSGRGKRPKSKIAKRNAPPGRKVGMISPRRTGRRKK